MNDQVRKKARDQEVASHMAERRRFIREQKMARQHRRHHDREISMWICARCRTALGDWEGEMDETDGVLRAMERARLLPPVYARLRNGVA